MKAILEFELPDDQEDFDAARQGRIYYGKLFDVQNIMRKYRKYHEKTIEQEELFNLIDNDIREEIGEL